MQLVFLTTSCLSIFLFLLLLANPVCSASSASSARGRGRPRRTTTTTSSTQFASTSTTSSTPSASTAQTVPEYMCDAQFGSFIQHNDCEDALKGIPDELQITSRRFAFTGTVVDFTLPKLFHAGSCTMVFSLDDQSDDSHLDGFTWYDPWNLAINLIRLCVDGANGVGGTARRDGFRVLLVHVNTVEHHQLVNAVGPSPATLVDRGFRIGASKRLRIGD